MSNFITFKSESNTVCFGNKHHSIFDCEQLANRPLIFGHQVHGCELVHPYENLKEFQSNHSQSLTKDCDALYTKSPKIALGIYTADCIPCFVIQKNNLFSLHLGWKGVHLKLLSKVLQKIDTKKDFDVYIGPHIQSDSFEVQLDLVEKFEKAFSNNQNWLIEKNSKLYISLKSILINELKSYKSAKIHTVDIDTFACEDFHSYRRDSSTKERNLSFAFLN